MTTEPCTLFDFPQVHADFEQELQALPVKLQQPLIDWHARLNQKGIDTCLLTPEAEKAYTNYADALKQLQGQHTLSDMLCTMYDFLASDALLIAALVASLENLTLKPTTIEISHVAWAQHCIEAQRERIHVSLSTEERKKVLSLSMDVIPQQTGRVVITGYNVSPHPFFVYIGAVVQIDDPSFHAVRLMAQRAYYR